MKKRVLFNVLLIICLLGIAFALTGCADRGVLPEGYVEVDSLRINDATVYLSPSGDTSKYQLNVEFLPANATNRKLTYFIPSQYLEFVTVDENGLISAKMEPEEEIRIPLTVTSTSNKKASLIVGLIIEYAEVKEISFVENDIELGYNGAPFQLAIAYTPYHAQDGRNITYTSLNPEVASVSASGLVTPLKAGNVTIVAVSKTMAGKESKAYFHATVKYAKSRFRLEVSDLSPKYKQTVNNPQPISFTLLSLEPNSDPNPRIQWYVGSERVSSMDNRMQYTHTPSASTVISYIITVKVLCVGEDEGEQSFESEEIRIYNDFSGFDFVSDNDSKVYDNYLYDDVKEFEITSTGTGRDHFNWYLKRTGQTTEGLYVGKTEYTSPNLTKKLNIEGDFSLTAVGCDADNNHLEGDEQVFNFNVNRFVEGDTIVLTPNVLNGGIPPESYNWYLFNVNELGEIVGNGTVLTETLPNVVIKGHTLYYKLTNYVGEKIVIRAKGMLDGRVAKVGDSEFSYETKPIMVYPKVGFTAINDEDDIIDNEEITQLQYKARTDNTITDVIIDGIYEIGAYTPLVYWSAVAGVSSYVVEVTKDNGEVLILNSTEYTGFGDNYCKIPTSFVTLQDQFKVRVKQKGGQYTPYYYYGYTKTAEDDIKYYFDKIETTQYSYLTAFTDIVDNGYIRSVKELGAIMDYICLFEPVATSNPLINVTYGVSIRVGEEIETYQRKYVIKVFVDVVYENIDEYYPINTDGTESLDAIYLNLFLLLKSAQNAYCETGDMRVNMIFDETDGGYFIHLYKDLNATTLIPPDPQGTVNTKVTEHYSGSPYGVNNTDFSINHKVAAPAYTSDQLYNIAEAGKLPTPQTTVVANIYNAAKQVVNKIIGKGMTDLEKVRAFYDYLILNVEYDYDVLNAIAVSEEDPYSYEAFHLEGVFLSRKAVCDGIAKAMSLLCRIEGIICYKVAGFVYTGSGAGHAWNKVYIDGEWYIVDATWGGTTLQNQINYKYFMMTDAQFSTYYTSAGKAPIIYGELEKAENYYNYYANKLINGHDTYIESISEFSGLLNSYGEIISENKVIVVRLSDTLLNANNYNLQQIIGAVSAEITGQKRIDTFLPSADNTVIVITLIPQS